MRHFYLLTSLLISVSSTFGQIGGSSTFSFLSLPSSARTVALGGTSIHVADWDAGNALQNPALLNPEQHQMVSVSMMNYFGDISFGNINMVWDLKNRGTLLGGLQYIRYGTFKQTDANGANTGTFTAAEYAYTLGYSHTINKYFTGGLTAKYIQSNLAGNVATGLAFDIGLKYRSSDSLIQGGLVVRNTGFMINGYSPNEKEKLPMDIQGGIAFKFKHAPFRISITGTNLNRQTAFINTSKPKAIDYSTGEVIEEKLKLSQKIMTHLTFGTEFLLGKWVQLRFGYNPRMRREMVIDAANGRPGMTGFSWGFGIRLPYVSFSYGSGLTFIGQGTNMFSMALDVNRFHRKK